MKVCRWEGASRDRFRGHGEGVGSLPSPVLPPPTSSAWLQGPRLCTSRGLHVRVNSQPASGTLPLSLYVCTQTLHFTSVRHCLADCLCHCTSVHRPCTSFRVQHCLANCLCHFTSVHRYRTSYQCSIVWLTAFLTVHLYADLVLLHRVAVAYWFVV